MQEVTTDSSNIIKGYFEKYVKMSKERKLNTDGKTTYNILKNKIEVNNEVIDYDNDNHRLYFLNKIISNLNSQFIDRFHGVTKRMLPLYYSEFEWRFNHRNCKSIMDKIKNYIMQSSIAARKMIRDSMDQYATARGLENAWGCQMGTHIVLYEISFIPIVFKSTLSFSTNPKNCFMSSRISALTICLVSNAIT